MPKRYNIRWKPSDEKELERVVRNFNAKIDRVSKKSPEKVQYLPDKITKKQLKAESPTRQDFKRNINQVSRFSKKGSENIRVTKEGLALTEYQYKEAVVMARVVTRARKRQAKNLSSETGTFSTIKKESLRPKKSIESVGNQGDFERYVGSLMKEIASGYSKDRADAYVNNWIQACYNKLGSYAQELVDKVLTIDPELFTPESISNPFMNIGFHYDKFSQAEKADTIMDELVKAFG